MTELELWSYTFRNTDLPELARAAAGAGFAAVTVTPVMFVRSGGDAAHLRARVEDEGMRVTFVDGLCSALPGTPPARSSSGSFRDPQEATLDDCIHIALETGARAINLVHIRGVATPVPQLAEAFAHACAAPQRTGSGSRSSSCPAPASRTSPPQPRWCARPARRTARCSSTPGTSPVAAARCPTSIPRRPRSSAGSRSAIGRPNRTSSRTSRSAAAKLPGMGALPLAEIVARVRAAHPDLPVGAEVLSDEVDALGLAEGTTTIARMMRDLVDASTSSPMDTSASDE